AVLHIYDELYKYSDKITHILTAHEQGAAHAADGYARATGKVGVCLATSGPGATNLVTGIATAYMDSIPMVAITGNVGVSLLGKDSFQEIDISGVSRSITKHNYIVKDIADLADTIREAFHIAQSGRKGPVLVDIPKDITVKEFEYIPQPLKPILTKLHTIRHKDLIEAKDMIVASEKPFIYMGGGIISSNATKELVEFAERIQAPVANSLMGTGGFSSKHYLSTGLVGMHGNVASNEGITHCDLLIAIGARFSDRVTSSIATFAPNAKILHIDIDPAEIGKNVKIDASIIGDAKVILQQLNGMLPQQNHDTWLGQVESWKRDYELTVDMDDRLHPQAIIQAVDRLTNGEAIITTEVGQHQMWAAQYFGYTIPRTFISSGGLGTMGFGTGASIGVQTALKDKTVVQIAGDGSFRMNCNELSTIEHYNLPIIIVLLNNTVLGMVRQWQTLFYEKRYSQTKLEDRGPDFVKLAQAYGVAGYEVKTEDEFNKVFEEALQSRKPAVINCLIHKDEKVLPMVAPGAPINDLIME
ncbi:MAG: acetolactate synthase, large subunit, biosynthetic type, partial [Epulopiscium sp. Nele67-Bin001]